MPKSGALIAVSFVGGLLGGLAKSLFLWGGTHWGILKLLNVRLSQSLDLPALYPAMFFGGLWGLLYFLTIGTPRQRCRWVRKGLWFSLIPSLVALFYLYPYVYHRGIGGLNLGLLTPLVIILGNLVWGFFTGFFTRFFWGR